jgi:hypothetical protein
VLLPSIDIAKDELKQRGLELDEKTIYSILRVTAELALAARRDKLLQWKQGTLQPDETLKGKRVAVAIDAGKTRTRVLKKGRRTSKGRRRYSTPWRDAKLLIIYVIDENGKRDRKFKPIVDGTFQSVDHLFELVSYYLFKLGAPLAESVIFLGDGADWIWNRIGTAAHKAGLRREQWRGCADLYHVMEQMNQALKVIPKWDAAIRKRERKKIKKWLLNDDLGKLVAYLKKLMKGRNEKTKKTIQGRIQYLLRRIDLIPYKLLMAEKFPIGSGAIESAVRRVINLRMKSPSIFWYPDNAEGMLHLRAQALTGRWDELMKSLQKRGQTSRNRNWKWEATPMSCLADENTEITEQHQLATLTN